MIAKEYLRKLYNLDKTINFYLDDIIKLKNLAVNISPILSDSVSKSNINKDKIGDCVSNIMELESLINDRIKQYTNLKTDVMNTIEKLENNDEKLVLMYRYIHFLNWSQVARKINFSKATVYRLHRQGLDNIDEILKVDS